MTVFAKPVPLTSASPQLMQVENQLYDFAQHNWIGARSAWSNVRRLERQMTDYGRTNLLPVIDDMRAAEARLVKYGSSGYRGLELRVLRASAKLMDITWPVKRWPVYVFTAGAMLCLLTSTVCHLLGCCARHVSQFIWRFDYVGIALLIVCSFYPPVYYGRLLSTYLHLAVMLINIVNSCDHQLLMPNKAAVLCVSATSLACSGNTVSGSSTLLSTAKSTLYSIAVGMAFAALLTIYTAARKASAMWTLHVHHA